MCWPNEAGQCRAGLRREYIRIKILEAEGGREKRHKHLIGRHPTFQQAS